MIKLNLASEGYTYINPAHIIVVEDMGPYTRVSLSNGDFRMVTEDAETISRDITLENKNKY